MFQQLPCFTSTMVLAAIHWWGNYSNNQSLSKCQGIGGHMQDLQNHSPLGKAAQLQSTIIRKIKASFYSAVYQTSKCHYFYNHLFTRTLSQRTLIDNKFWIIRPKFCQILFHSFSFSWLLCFLYIVTKFAFIHTKDTAKKGNGRVHILKTAISLITRYSLDIIQELIINVCASMSMLENIILLQYKKLLYNGLS